MSSSSSSKLSITVKKRKSSSALKKRQSLLSKNNKKRHKANPPSSSGLPAILQCRAPSLTLQDKNDNGDPKKIKAAAAVTAEKEEVDEFPPLPDSASAPDDIIPCDSILAIRSLVQKRACCHIHVDKNEERRCSKGIPFVLRSMIHYTLFSSTSSSSAGADHNQILSANASTGVSIEIDNLARENKIRLLRLHGAGGEGEEDVAVMEIHNYVKGIWDAFNVWSNSRQHQEQTRQHYNDSSSSIELLSSSLRTRQAEEKEKLKQFVQLFISSLSQMTGLSVSDSTFENAFQQNQSNRIKLLPSLSSTQKQIDALIDMGLLLPKRSHRHHHTSSSSSYWFTLPGMGTVAKYIAQKRSRLLLKILRSRYKEIKRSVLEQQDEDGIFFMRDLLSRGNIKIYVTSSGEEFIRLV